jgi:rhodanese-related sulfurtransferase
MSAPAITVEDLKSKRDRGEPVTLVDVREPHEWAISELPGSVKIPLGTLPQRLAELPKDAEIVVYCRSGGRSANAVRFLRQKGYEKAFNLAGGINHWAEQIDPTMARY